jgi:nudix-type nucleoside diphosphatase (YffH/AdpP family)
MPQKIITVRTAYDGYLKVLSATLTDAAGQTVTREILERGSAAAVLAYDPDRRTALMVRLPRAPVLLATGQATSFEVIAGMIEEEGAEVCARREAMEEAGVVLTTLEPVATAFSSPGFTTERISMFLAPYAASDRTAAGGGVAQEHEDIEVVELPLAELWAMVGRGEIADMKTFALIHALRARRAALFEG